MTMICLDYNILHHVKNNTVYITLCIHLETKKKACVICVPVLFCYKVVQLNHSDYNFI